VIQSRGYSSLEIIALIYLNQLHQYINRFKDFDSWLLIFVGICSLCVYELRTESETKNSLLVFIHFVTLNWAILLIVC